MAVEYHLSDEFTAENSCVANLPPEIWEIIFQLTPASQHRNLRRVCRKWNEIIDEPLSKREVLVNLAGFEAAWQCQLGGVFATASLNMNAVQAYGDVLAMWIVKFVGQQTLTLTLSGHLCEKVHIFWPRFVEQLDRKCSKLRRMIFQCGQVHLDALENPPKNVRTIYLKNVRVIKRHREEGYMEPILHPQQCSFVEIRYGSLGVSVENFIRALADDAK